MFFLGPAALAEGVVAEDITGLATARFEVVGDEWTQVELEPGTYWVLVESAVQEALVVACDGGSVSVVESVAL